MQRHAVQMGADHRQAHHLAADADHVHLVCRDCGKITEVSPDAVRPLLTALDKEQSFETDVGHLTVFGRCGQCRVAAG